MQQRQDFPTSNPHDAAAAEGLASARRLFYAALLRLDRTAALDVLSQALAAGHGLPAITESCIAPTLETIGSEWEMGHLALSQVFMTSRIAEDTIDRLFPPGDASGSIQPRIALALLEDYHALGKRLVALNLRAAGYSILDYGHVQAQELVEKILADGVEVLLISTLMLRSALQVRRVCDGLIQAGRHIPVIVGGAPFRFDPELWREVGATATGASASDAIRLVQAFLEQRRDA